MPSSQLESRVTPVLEGIDEEIILACGGTGQ